MAATIAAHRYSGLVRVPAVLACVPLLLSLASPVDAQPAAPAMLPIERVAALPSLIGTAPASPTWAPDSQHLAFLWNDAGWPFRDIWVVAADGSGLRRVTDMQRDVPGPALPDGDTTEALAARAAARARGGVGELLWGRDGRSLLFTYRGDAYRIAVDGTGLTPLAATGGVSDLALSPDGGRLGFIRDGDLWVLDVTTPGARPERLTELGVAGIGTAPVGTYNRADAEVGTGVWGADWPPFAWAPDGRRIAFHHVDRRHLRKVPFPYYLGKDTVANELRRGYPGDENERRTLGLVHLETKRVEMLPIEAPGARAVSDFSWSPSGRLLVDQVSDTGAERWLFVVEPGTTTLRPVWHDRRDSRIYPAYVARWASDGRTVYVVADLDERDRLYALDVDAAGATPRPLTSGDWDVAGERGAATVHVDGARKAIYVTGTMKNPYERHVYRLPEGGGPAVAVTSRAGVHVPVVSPDGTRLALVWSDDVTPPELLVSGTAAGAEERRVTTSPPEEFRRHTWVRARYATYKNAVDGFPVHARILEPAGLDRSRRHPVLFGPVYSNTVRNRWGGLTGTLQQALVQRGYIVVQADVRGSVGYGRAFREAFLMDYGGRDLDDLAAVADGLKALPYVDGERMGIWGSSYGGLLSVYALLKRPAMFQVGVAGAPATDPFAFGPDDVAITRSPQTHPDAFVRGSAQQLGADLRGHLMIVHGMMDDVVPFRTTLTLVERLMLLGKDVDLVTAPGATHAWSAREHYAVYFYRKLVDYFERWLK
jgi:dipeptidyl-peptidase-4